MSSGSGDGVLHRGVGDEDRRVRGSLFSGKLEHGIGCDDAGIPSSRRTTSMHDRKDEGLLGRRGHKAIIWWNVMKRQQTLGMAQLRIWNRESN